MEVSSPRKLVPKALVDGRIKVEEFAIKILETYA